MCNARPFRRKRCVDFAKNRAEIGRAQLHFETIPLLTERATATGAATAAALRVSPGSLAGRWLAAALRVRSAGLVRQQVEPDLFVGLV